MADQKPTPKGGFAPQAEAQPARSVSEVVRDMTNERAALEKALDDLQREVGEGVDQVKRQATRLGRTALVVGPIAGAVVGGLAVAVALLRRRRRDGD